MPLIAAKTALMVRRLLDEASCGQCRREATRHTLDQSDERNALLLVDIADWRLADYGGGG